MDTPSNIFLQVFSPSGKRITYEIGKVEGDVVFGKIIHSELKSSHISGESLLDNNEVCLDKEAIKRMIENMQKDRENVSKAVISEAVVCTADLSSVGKN